MEENAALVPSTVSAVSGDTPPPLASASESAPTPIALLQQIGSGVATAVETAAEHIAPVLDKASKAVGDTAAAARPALESTGKKVGEFATDTGKKVGAFATDAAGKVGAFASDTADKVHAATAPVVEKVSAATAPVVEHMKAQTAVAVETVKKYVPPEVSQAASTAAASVGAAAATIGSWFGRAAASIAGLPEPAFIVLTGIDGAGKTCAIGKIRELAKNAGATGLPREGLVEAGVEAAELNGLILVERSCTTEEIAKWLPGASDVHSGVRAVAFIVDATNREGLTAARDALREIMTGLCATGAALEKGGALLVIANKNDLENCANTEEIAGALGLRTLPSPYVVWNVLPATALAGAGLAEGLEWISEVINV